MTKPLDHNKLRPINEEAVWVEFKAGDKTAFESIYRFYFKDLFRYGMSVLPDEALIKDAIQELFVDLWKHRETLSKPIQLRFYLIKSLRNKVYRHIDSNKRSELSASRYQKERIQYLPSKEEEIILSDSQSLRTRKLTLLINDLPERQREAIMLIFFESKTYEETATIMSMTVQSVYTLIWKATSSLKKKLHTHLKLG